MSQKDFDANGTKNGSLQTAEDISCDLGGDILAHMPSPVILFASDTLDVVWLNTAARDWFRVPETPGKSLFQLAPGLSRLQTVLGGMGATDTARGRDLWLRLGDGQERVCQYVLFYSERGMVLILDLVEAGLPVGAEDSQTAPVAMLGRMLAHELKNPLAGISGAAQLLETGLSAASDKELTALIRSEVGRIGRLADKMENFATGVPSKPEKFNVHSVLRRALLLFQTRKDTEIDYIENYDPSLPELEGDADRLMQIFVNLLANATQAIKQSSTGSRIEIQTRYRGGVRKRGRDGQTLALPLEISIRDDGPGIREEIRDMIFQPFVTTKANGHGLGLALVARIVHEHGGLIEHKSRPGQTVFSILLPTGLGAGGQKTEKDVI